MTRKKKNLSYFVSSLYLAPAPHLIQQAFIVITASELIDRKAV